MKKKNPFCISIFLVLFLTIINFGQSNTPQTTTTKPVPKSDWERMGIGVSKDTLIVMEIHKTKFIINGNFIDFWVKDTPLKPSKEFLENWAITEKYSDKAEFNYRLINYSANCKNETLSIKSIFDYWKDGFTDSFTYDDNKYEPTPPDSVVEKIVKLACEYHLLDEVDKYINESKKTDILKKPTPKKKP